MDTHGKRKEEVNVLNTSENRPKLDMLASKPLKGGDFYGFEVSRVKTIYKLISRGFGS